MTIQELKKEIEEQRNKNISLFKIFEYKMHKEEMQQTIEEWREGSKKLKSMLQELSELERITKDKNKTIDNTKTFVNGF
jgi:thiamine biosynthesis lipoprotein ApbE